MFGILLLVGLCVIAVSFVIWKESDNSNLWIIVGIIGLVMIAGAFFTPQGNLYMQKLKAQSGAGNWLVVDNSGGETLRHWLLEDAYVESSSQSDGWQFYDSQGNGPIYVAGDSFVMKINEPLRSFEEGYKVQYNIPADQKPLR